MPKKLASANPVADVMSAQREFLQQRAAVEREKNKELACLVQTKGWLYAQHVANEIQKEYECKPTDPNWTTYTTIQYALNQLFGRVRQKTQTTESPEARKAAETASITERIAAEIKAKYGDRSSGNAKSTTGGSNRRRGKAGA